MLGGVDEVFKALADPTRRSLLDELFGEDGQTLSALEARFSMTRFGVMKHLKQLEDAGLVVTKRRGREKLHFLNPVPIRLVHDRWVTKFAEPWTATLSNLKQRLEHTMEQVFEIYIRTTPERLWEAITDGEIRAKYNFGAGAESDWKPGSRYELRHPQGPLLLAEGEVLEAEPPLRLVHTMVALWSDEVKSDGTSRVTWDIEPVAAGSTFSVVRVGNSGVYRQASTDGTPSSSLTTASANQAIQAQVTPRATVGANAWIGLTTRRAGSSYYYVTLRASGAIELKRLVNGAFTTLAAAPASFSTGQTYRLRLESIGTLHRVYLDDVSVLTARDATLREGVPGVITNRASADFDSVVVTSSPLTTINKQPFEDYYTRESWTEHSGTWSPTSVGYRQSSLTDYGRAFTGALADDQVVQARIRPTAFASPDNWVGLMARYLDERNYLYVSLRARGVISLWRRTNGANTHLATRSMAVTPGTLYDVRLEVVGGLTRVFVNEQLQLSSSADPGPTVPNVSWSKGQVGIITYRATADFEDILAYQP
jgi:uncharacterized protein YndB with AHSA1/START domain